MTSLGRLFSGTGSALAGLHPASWVCQGRTGRKGAALQSRPACKNDTIFPMFWGRNDAGTRQGPGLLFGKRHEKKPEGMDVGKKNRMFGVTLICINCRPKADRQPRASSSRGYRPRACDRSFCSQCFRNRRRMERTVLSSKRGFSSITEGAFPAMMPAWSERGTWE